VLWVKVKVAGRRQQRVVLFALGMREDNGTGFLDSLYQRGLRSPLLVIHDGSQAMER